MDFVTDEYQVYIFVSNNDINSDEIFVSEKTYEQLSINTSLNKSQTAYAHFFISNVYHKIKVNIDTLNHNITEYVLHFKYKNSRKNILKK